MIVSPRRRRGFTLIEVMISVTILSVLMGIAVPNWMQSRTRTNQRACQRQLRMIRGAKDSYVMTWNLSTGTVITMTDLVNDGWLPPGVLCPHGYSYTIGAVNDNPTCPSSLAGHVCE